MKVKICCGQMESYAGDSSYIRVEDKHAVIDTAMYDENPVDIDYCPFCGKKIELVKEKGE